MSDSNGQVHVVENAVNKKSIKVSDLPINYLTQQHFGQSLFLTERSIGSFKSESLESAFECVLNHTTTSMAVVGKNTLLVGNGILMVA